MKQLYNFKLYLLATLFALLGGVASAQTTEEFTISSTTSLPTGWSVSGSTSTQTNRVSSPCVQFQTGATLTTQTFTKAVSKIVLSLNISSKATTLVVTDSKNTSIHTVQKSDVSTSAWTDITISVPEANQKTGLSYTFTATKASYYISKVTVTYVDGESDGDGEGGEGEGASVAAPVATATGLNEGTSVFNNSISVALASETEGATIYYTTDGNDPTNASQAYESPITISSTTTLKAIAYDADENASSVTSQTYTYVVGAPAFSITETTHTEAFSTTITSATTAATIYYTTDNSTPSAENGTALTNGGSIDISETTTVKAIAIDANSNASAVTTIAYSVVGPIELTEEITFKEFKNLAASYNTSIQGGLIASDSITYLGWTKYQVSYKNSSTNIMQMKASAGKLTLPTVKSAKGFTITVTFSKGSGSNPIELVYGSTTSTFSGTLSNNQDGTGNTVSLEITDTSAAGIAISNSTSGAAYVSEIKLTPITSNVTRPTISAQLVDADGEEITDGNFETTAYVTITSVYPNASIYFTTDGSDPKASEDGYMCENGTYYDGPFTISNTTTVKAFVCTTDDETYEMVWSPIASKTYTFTGAYEGIRGIRNAINDGIASGKATITDGVVTYKNGSYTYIQDGSYPGEADGAGIVLYSNSSTLTAGQTINGTVTFSGGQIYNGLTEITALGTTDATVGDADEANIPDPITIGAEELASNIEIYESYYIEVKDGGIGVPSTLGRYETQSLSNNTVLNNRTSNTLYLDAADETIFQGFAVNYNNTVIAHLYVYSQDNLSQMSMYTLKSGRTRGTLYSPAAYTIYDNDLTAKYAVAAADGTLTWQTVAEDATIPAGSAVVLEGDEEGQSAIINFLNFDSTAALDGNMLHGGDAVDSEGKTYVEGEDVKYYFLGTKNGEQGFYWGAADGAAMTYQTGKAFLAVPGASSVMGFKFDGSIVTGIDALLNETESNSNAATYDLQGRRVQNAQKGIYIKNGKKVIIK